MYAHSMLIIMVTLCLLCLFGYGPIMLIVLICLWSYYAYNPYDYAYYA